MARFDIYPNPDGEGYLLDVQADILVYLRSRVVVPLQPKAVAHIPMARLNPVIEVDGSEMVMMTHFLSAVPTSILQAPLANLEPQRDVILDAMDFLQQGF
jgi:toxin CcdB